MATGDLLSFGPYLLDTGARRLTRDGEHVRIGSRHIQLLCYLVERAGELVAKETLIQAIWSDVAVTTASLDQAVYLLRRALPMPSGDECIETHPRRGIRFSAPVVRKARRDSDDSLAAILSAHLAWTEGRAALDKFEAGAVGCARAAFERVVAQIPEQASAHVGLANACALQFEMTRTDAEPDVAALKVALAHALEARRLDPRYGEAWATLGFVLERVSWCQSWGPQAWGPALAGPVTRDDALGAHRHSLVLEPDNWRHHLRLSACAWGEERLRAARRTLVLLPGLAVAHVLAATVLVARGLLDDALEELRTATAFHDTTHPSPYGCPAAHWLTGLILLARGERDAAMAAFQRELDQEQSGHLYGKEVAANTWYAIGAARFHAGEHDDAREAFGECLRRVPKHPMARAAVGEAPAATDRSSVYVAIARAIAGMVGDERTEGQPTVVAIEGALMEAPPGNAGWLLPIEPMLTAGLHSTLWVGALSQLRNRAA